MKRNQGITLIALIITIIIMLILVGITINIAMDGELFGKANEAIKQQKIAEDRERLETAKEAERIEGYEDPENEPYPDVDDYFDRLVEEGIINNKDEDVVDNGDDTYEVTTKEEHVFKVTETEDEIIIDYIGEANRLGPTITNIEVKNKTTNSIEIEVIGQRLKDVTYTYEYKKEGESEWKTAGTTEENTHIYTGLEANEIYNIRVKVENKRGSSEKETSVRTGEMTTGKVSFGETIWENGEAKIEVTNSEEGYRIEYQINSISGEWTEIANGGEIAGLKHGDTVYARLTDGTNHGEYASADIQDKTTPQVTVTAGATTSNSIAVNVMASDNESGMADSLTYTYYIKTTTGNTYEQKASNGSASYTFTGLTQGATYDIKVEVQGDKAGNKGEGSTQGTTGKVTSGIEQGAITFGSTTWSGNKASVTVNTNTSYTIEYQVNSIAGTWTTIANGGTISGLNHGDTVYARLTDGINAGQYASTSITDGTAPQVTVTAGTTTSNSIAVSVTASDGQSGMADSLTYTYYIKKTTEGEYVQKASNNSASYTFAGLTQETRYDIKVEVQGDKAGNTGTGTAQVTTGKVTSGLEQGAITFGSTTWSGNKASVTVNTNTSYTIEYQVNSIAGTWTTIANGGTISGLNHGDTVYARLTDGINAGQYASTSITDGTAPQVTVTAGTTTSNSIAVSVTASDGQSGMADSLTYTYYIKKTTEGEYVQKASNNSASYTFTDLIQETSYDVKVEVQGDKAGNKGTGTAQATTGKVTSGLEQGAITFGSTTWSANKASITISTNTSYTIEYQINSINGQWTTVVNGGTVSGLNHGDTVYARLTDGINAGQYASTSITDGIAPSITVNPGTTTSNSIAVSVIASDGQSGMADSITYTYYIKKTTESSYTQKASNSNASYTFTGLTQGTAYDIKVEVQGDRAGNKGTGTAQATTGTVTSGLEQGAITFGSTTWSSHQASITISTNTSYTIEYQVNSISGQWTAIANGGTVTGLKHGDTVYARLTDGINAGQHASASITDGTAPTISSFTVTAYDTTSITVSASATDNESGIYSYQFQYKLSTVSSYTTATTTVTSDGTCTYKYTGLADGTTYNLRVIVTDKVNQTSNKTANQTTVDAGPALTTSSLKSKTTNSITISARATDGDGDKLTYRLYTSTSQNGTYTQKATTTANQNTTVTLNATGLSNYTTYWWYVTVSDGKETKTSSKRSVRTYCPGTGLTCTGPFTEDVNCTTCNGTGQIDCPASGTRTERTRAWCYGCKKAYYKNLLHCSDCGALLEGDAEYHKDENGMHSCTWRKESHKTSDCEDCNATGIITNPIECTHGLTETHSYCSHGYTSQH